MEERKKHKEEKRLELERIRKEHEEEEKRKQEQTDMEKSKRELAESNPMMKKVLDWIDNQEKMKKEEEAQKDRIKGLQEQIAQMTKTDNQKLCPILGVNMFGGLEAIQGTGNEVDLVAKAQNAMMAAATAKRKREEGEDSEGESVNSILSKKKNINLRSGLAPVAAHKVKMEVEWAHHWLGKEFEANPVSFNQIKLGHYMAGESEILLHCNRPEEFRARLKLMSKIGYWSGPSFMKCLLYEITLFLWYFGLLNKFLFHKIIKSGILRYFGVVFKGCYFWSKAAIAPQIQYFHDNKYG